MPRHVIERTFPTGLGIAATPAGAMACRALVDRNAEEGVRGCSRTSARTTRRPSASTRRPRRKRSGGQRPATDCRSTGSPRSAFSIPTSMHEEVRTMREARFRIAIVAAYNYTCALTGYRLTTITAGSIVDAAHIHQFANSQNNDPQNDHASLQTGDSQPHDGKRFGRETSDYSRAPTSPCRAHQPASRAHALKMQNPQSSCILEFVWLRISWHV